MRINKYITYTFLFGLIFFKQSISFLIITSFPNLAENFDLNHIELGTIVSVYYLSSIVFMFFWIYLFGKYSRQKIFLINSLVWILGIIIFGFSQHYIHLLIISAIIGCGIEASTVFILLILLQMTPNESEGKLFSFYITIQGLGALFGIFITSYFRDILNYDWSFVFIFIGFFSLLWLIIAGIILIESKNVKNEITPYLEQLGYNLNLNEIKKIFNIKTNRSLVIIWLYSVPIVTFLNVWLQIYFQEYHLLSQMEASLSFIFLSGAEFLGIVFGGFLYDKYYSTKHYKKIYIAVISSIISIPLLVFGFLIYWKKNSLSTDIDLLSLAFDLYFFAINNTPVFVSYIILFLGFFSIALMYPFFLIIINDCNDDAGKNSMIGLQKIILIIGNVISPVIGGFLIVNFSILITMIIVPFFMIIPILHLFLIRNTIEKDFLLNIREKDDNLLNS